MAAAESLAEHADRREDWRVLSQMARRDPQPEARRAALLAFTRCPQSRTLLSAARAALKDESWHVRRAGVQVLASCNETSAHKLLLDKASDETENEAVRGAALRALARLDAPRAIELACRMVSEGDAALTEDAYATLLFLQQAEGDMLKRAAETCPPRAAAIINFINTVTSEQ